MFLSNFSSSQPFWLATDAWSSCSSLCGPGHERRIFICVIQSVYETLERMPNAKCSGLTDPSYDDVRANLSGHLRPCNYGDCSSSVGDVEAGSTVTKTSGALGNYRWRVSEWGFCSQICGNAGTMSRDVDCVFVSPLKQSSDLLRRRRAGRNGEADDSTTDANEHDEVSTLVVAQGETGETFRCSQHNRPSPYAPCNRFGCHGEFYPEKWDKVSYRLDPTDPTRTGRHTCSLQYVNAARN
ncbi:unnamed protein product [Protopolystoma xenopodis]|uniref:Uncharacterized protein n=1 Tax=Protopolystoma xenopodis TaxID=117903 RepID=A0A3S5A2R1_9PLAT|nr:unnamed protein product [Protopolystoma xenopodis]